MARTLVGQLILRLRSEGLGEADKVARTLRDIESAAKTLGSVRAGDWGTAFGKQLGQLKATPAELEAVRRSWGNLIADLDNNNVAKALRKQSIATWKTATISHLAAVRAEAEEAKKHILALNRALGYGVKPLMVMGGGYTAAYMGGIVGREALIAASNERRGQAEAKYAGLDAGERGKIDTRADELSERYRLPKSQIYDVLKEASLSMPSTDSALAVSEEMARAYLVLSNKFGSEGALVGLRQFNKAMDNIERVTPEEYRYGLENYMKAQQVVGMEMDPTAFAEAIKFARTGGKVFGDEFLFQWLPMLIAESGGSDSGTQLRAAFDQFIVGRASKAALGEQEALGLRDEAGRLLNQEKFTENPLTWIWDTMLPKLREKGVDTEDETELARVIGQLTNNRLSSDLILRAILSMQQYRRLVEERLPNAVGLDAADSIQNDNPFAAWEGFKSSLENLSAAVLPMDHVSAALNTLADGINTLAAAARDNPALAALGIGVGGAALYGGGKYGISLLSDMFGLKSSALALDGSAAALTRAAVALGGAGVADGLTPDGKPGGGKGGLWSGFAGGALAAIVAAAAAASLNLAQTDAVKTDAEIERDRHHKEALKKYFEENKNADGNAWWRFLFGEAADPNFDPRKHFKINNAINTDSITSPPALLRQMFADDISPAMIEQIYEDISRRYDLARPPEDGQPPLPTSRGGLPAQGPIPAARPEVEFGNIVGEAQQIGADILAALSVSAKPNIDLASLLAARDLAQQTLNLIRQIGPVAQAAAAKEDARTARELRRSMSDYGVAP